MAYRTEPSHSSKLTPLGWALTAGSFVIAIMGFIATERVAYLERHRRALEFASLATCGAAVLAFALGFTLPAIVMWPIAAVFVAVGGLGFRGGYHLVVLLTGDFIFGDERLVAGNVGLRALGAIAMADRQRENLAVALPVHATLTTIDPVIDVVIAANTDLGNFSGYAPESPEYQDLVKKIHDATIKAGKFFGATNPAYGKGRPDSADFRFLQNGPSFDGWQPPNRGGAAGRSTTSNQ